MIEVLWIADSSDFLVNVAVRPSDPRRPFHLFLMSFPNSQTKTEGVAESGEHAVEERSPTQADAAPPAPDGLRASQTEYGVTVESPRVTATASWDLTYLNVYIQPLLDF